MSFGETGRSSDGAAIGRDRVLRAIGFLQRQPEIVIGIRVIRRGFYGAARAAAASGDKEKSAVYFLGLARLTNNADSDRAEIREAKHFVAK